MSLPVEMEQHEIDVFFRVSLDMLCISSYDGYFKKVNPAFERVLGFTTEELCSTPYLELMHPDDVEKSIREVEKQLVTGQSVLTFENRYRCRDGSYRLLSWKSTPVGSLMYAAARDVTEERQAEAELRRAKAEAESANRELEAFSYSVAHDLRSPLQRLVAFGSFVLEDPESRLSDDSRLALDRMVGASHKMSHLIDGLLGLCRIQKRDLRKERVDLSALAREIARDLQGAQPNRTVDLRIAEGVEVEGDPVLLRQALANLLENAWKYTGRTAAPRIEFGAAGTNAEKAVFVRDNGAGFDMKYAEKLFHVFERLHSESEFQGNGIGLATVMKIVRFHGGRLWAEAAEGRGATFYFSI